MSAFPSGSAAFAPSSLWGSGSGSASLWSTKSNTPNSNSPSGPASVHSSLDVGSLVLESNAFSRSAFASSSAFAAFDTSSATNSTTDSAFAFADASRSASLLQNTPAGFASSLSSRAAPFQPSLNLQVPSNSKSNSRIESFSSYSNTEQSAFTRAQSPSRQYIPTLEASPADKGLSDSFTQDVMRQDAVLVREMGRMLQEPSTPDSSAVAASTAALHLLVSPSPASPSPTPLFQQQLAHASTQSAPVHHANQNPMLQPAFSQNMNQNMFPPQQLPMPNGHFFPAANMSSMKHPGLPFHPMTQPHLPPVPMMVPPHMQPHLPSHMQPPMQPPMGFAPMFPAVGHHFPMGANGQLVPPPMMVPPPVFMPRQMDPQMQSRQMLQQQMAFAMAHGLPPMPMPSGALLVPPAHSATVSASSSAQGSRSSSPPPLNDTSAYHTATVESHPAPMHQPTSVPSPIPTASASIVSAAIPITTNTAAPSAGSQMPTASQSDDDSDYEESDYSSDDSQSLSDQSDSAASDDLSQSESDDESALNAQPPPVSANSTAPLSFAAVIAKNAPGAKPASAPSKSASSTTATSSATSNSANSSLPKQVLAAAQAAGQITLPQLLQQQQSGQAATASVRLQGIGPISISILASTPATNSVAAPVSNPPTSNRVTASGNIANIAPASISSNKPASVAPPKIVLISKTTTSNTVTTVPAVVPAAPVPILESSSESEESDIEDDATTKLAKLPPATNLKQRYRSLWSLSENDEKAKIRDFWLALTENQRGQLLRVDKDSILNKIRDAQRAFLAATALSSASAAAAAVASVAPHCAACSRCRHVIDSELDSLYERYFAEMTAADPSLSSDPRRPITVNGSVLNVSDEVLRAESRRFVDLLELAAERRFHYAADPVPHQTAPPLPPTDDDAAYADDLAFEEQQRVDEARRIFQMLAAKSFEQRVVSAFREHMSLEKQRALMDEEAEEHAAAERRRLKKQQKKSTKRATAQKKAPKK